MTKTTKYTCIKTFRFTGSEGRIAFTEGKTYEGWQDKLGNVGDIELTDDTPALHTITAGLFLTLFKGA